LQLKENEDETLRQIRLQARQETVTCSLRQAVNILSTYTGCYRVLHHTKYFHCNCILQNTSIYLRI